MGVMCNSFSTLSAVPSCLDQIKKQRKNLSIPETQIVVKVLWDLLELLHFTTCTWSFFPSVVTECGGALNSSVCSEDVDICNSLYKKNNNTRNHDCYVMSFVFSH